MSTVADVKGYDVDGVYPATGTVRSAPRLAQPSACVCKPAVGISFSRAFAYRAKYWYRQFTDPSPGTDAKYYRRMSVNTVENRVQSVTNTYVLHPSADPPSGTATQTTTTTTHLDKTEVFDYPDTKAFAIPGGTSESGTGSLFQEEAYSDSDGSTESSTYDVHYIYDPTLYAGQGSWTDTWTGTETRNDGSVITQHGASSNDGSFNDNIFNHPFDQWILDSTTFPAENIKVETYVPAKGNPSAPGLIPDTSSTGSKVVTTTLSNEYTDQETDLAALLDAAESFTETVWWYQEAYFGSAVNSGYRVSANYFTITEPGAGNAVTAAEADVTAKQAALDAIDSENTYDRHVAQNALELAQLGLTIAQHNQTQVGNSNDPILLTLTTDTDPPESYRTKTDDGSSITACAVRFRLTAFVMPDWHYAEKPVQHDFRWRRASANIGDAEPAFSDETVSVENAIPLLRLIGSYRQKLAFAVMESPEQLAAPSSPGWVALANPLPLGATEPAPFLSSWTEKQLRQAAAQKLGFLAYLPPEDGVPVIYRRETASGSAVGYHEFKETIYINEDEPGGPPVGSLWEYDASNLPESIRPANTSTFPGDSSPHLRNFPQSGVIVSPTVQMFGPLTMTLSLPWTTEEIQELVDAHIDAGWPDPPDYSQPPYVPDTNAAASLPPEPRAARWLRSAETYYLRARSRYRSSFDLPDSIRKHPDFSAGVTVTWFWQVKNLNLDTNAVTSEDVSEAILYGPHRTTVADTWRDLPSPEGNAIKWVTKPKNLEAWAWTAPECRPVCVVE